MTLLSKAKSAFTLIELLIATALLVVVSLAVTGVLANALQAQDAHQRGQLISTQENSLLSQISQSISQSLSAYDASGNQITASGQGADKTGLQILPLSAGQSLTGYAQDSALILTLPVRDEQGRAVGDLTQLGNYSDYIKQVYCAEPQSSTTPPVGKELVRFTVTPANTPLSRSGFSSGLTCTLSQVQNLFPGATVKRDLLSDPRMQIAALRFWPVWSTLKTPSGSQPYNIDPPAVRIEISAVYNLNNGGGNFQSRVGDQNSLIPTVSRLLVARTLPASTPALTNTN